MLGGGLPGDVFIFVGTPAGDGRGNGFAAATSSQGQTAIFCFNSGATISADLPVGSNAINPSVQIIQQSVDANHDEFNQTPTLLIGGTNFNAGTTGHITFNNFGQPSGVYLYPFFSEGEPIQVQYPPAPGPGPGRAPPPAPPPPPAPRAAALGGTMSTMPTNIPTVGSIGGLVAVGDYLYFTYGAVGSGSMSDAHLYRLYTQVGANKNGYLDMNAFNSAKKPILQDLGAVDIGGVAPLQENIASTGDITSSNGSLIVSGVGGVVNYQPEMTLVTDKTRLMGLDADGDAMFAVDSTDEQQTMSTIVNDKDVSTGTHIPLDNPTDITQLSTDRYLLADEGNNRCVEIDRKGNVLWEVSSFTAPFMVLNPNDPSTLSDPTSVQVWRDDKNNVHYLIADSGNYRIVDIVDLYDATTGSTQPTHYIDWVSRTGSRKYRYERAFRYVKSVTTSGSTTTTTYGIAAVVTNKTIAPMNGTNLSPTRADTTGGTNDHLNPQFSKYVIHGYGPGVNPQWPNGPQRPSGARFALGSSALFVVVVPLFGF